MILPDEIVPQYFGLNWGMSWLECLRATLAEFDLGSDYWMFKNVIFHENTYRVGFMVESDMGLRRIEATVKSSKPFDELHNDIDVDIEELTHYTNDTFANEYTRLLQQYSALLGAPAYSGSSDDLDYPVEETLSAMSAWIHKGSYLRLSYGQPDSQSPYLIILSANPIL